jgi:hypothetical protein
MSGSVRNHTTNILPAQDPMFVPARGEEHVRDAPGGQPGGPHDAAGDVLAAAVAALRSPGLVVVTGAPGTGRTTVLRRLQEGFRGPVFAGGGLAMLRAVPALPLARALRVRLPVHDAALLAEAVRSRVRHGLLVLDDLQWADPLTVAALPAVAAHCRVAVALRTPHRLPADAEQALREAATGWYTVPKLTDAAAAALVRQIAPSAAPAAVAEIVRRAGGVPLALIALAGTSARREAVAGPVDGSDLPGLTYAVATALSDLNRSARTAMAALGLLGRPAGTRLLGEAVGDLRAAGLVEVTDEVVAPVSPYVAEVAAGLLDAAERQALHRRLAEAVPPREAARHLAAGGQAAAAYRVAVDAAAAATSSGERAELLLLACELPDVPVDTATRLSAARAALAAGRPPAALRVLGSPGRPVRLDLGAWRGAAAIGRVGGGPRRGIRRTRRKRPGAARRG